MHGFSVRGLATALSVVGLAAFTASCASSDGGTNRVADAIFGHGNPNVQNATVVDAQTFGATTSCPPVAIRPGTESYQVFAGGKKVDPITGETPPIVFQASFNETARECAKTPGGVSVKLGIQGRVVGGPAGKPGPVTLPVRVAVLDSNDQVVKSDLIRIAVDLDATMSVPFENVDDNLVIPAQDATGYKIYVGFDDSAPATKAKRKR